MIHSLGSSTSGVDGSSEGGRINTINIPGALVIYGVALVQSLQRRNPKTRLSVAPAQLDGIGCMELSYQGDEPSGAPAQWHGHRVPLKRSEPPAPPSRLRHRRRIRRLPFPVSKPRARGQDGAVARPSSPAAGAERRRLTFT